MNCCLKRIAAAALGALLLMSACACSEAGNGDTSNADSDAESLARLESDFQDYMRKHGYGSNAASQTFDPSLATRADPNSSRASSADLSQYPEFNNDGLYPGYNDGQYSANTVQPLGELHALRGFNQVLKNVKPVSASSFYGRSLISRTASSSKKKAMLTLYDRLAEGAYNCSAWIRVDDPGCEKLTDDELDYVGRLVSLDNPQLFWIDNQHGGIRCVRDDDSDFPRHCYSFYKFEKWERDDKIAEVEAVAKQLLSGIKPSMSQLEREKYIFSEFMSHMTHIYPDDIYWVEYDRTTVYDALVKGKSGPRAAAQAFRYLCGLAGIESRLEIGHGQAYLQNIGNNYRCFWVVVTIDGVEYNVDVACALRSGNISVCFNASNADFANIHNKESAYDSKH